jgi:hypothetical protein
MGDLIEMNARRMEQLPEEDRVAMSLEEAYRIACLSDSELAPVFQKAEADAVAAAEAEKAKAGQTPAQRVASSIRSRPGGAARPTDPAPKTRRDGLAKMWAERFEGRGQ